MFRWPSRSKFLVNVKGVSFQYHPLGFKVLQHKGLWVRADDWKLLHVLSRCLRKDTRSVRSQCGVLRAYSQFLRRSHLVIQLMFRKGRPEDGKSFAFI